MKPLFSSVSVQDSPCLLNEQTPITHLSSVIVPVAICAVCAGSDSALPLEIATQWTPPEVQKARDRKHESVVADPSTDIWAFGIMGYELLTGKTAFPPGLPRGTIRRMLHGKAPLPWEANAHSSELSAELTDNELKGIVLSCLARKPAVRPSAAALAATLGKLLAASAGSAAAADAHADAAAAVAAAERRALCAPGATGVGGGTGALAPSRAADQPSEISVDFLRVPLTHTHEGYSVDAAAPSPGDGALPLASSALAVTAVRSVSDGGTHEAHDGDTAQWALDTLDNSGSFKACEPAKQSGTVASGDLASQALRSEMSVTAAMW